MARADRRVNHAHPEGKLLSLALAVAMETFSCFPCATLGAVDQIGLVPWKRMRSSLTRVHYKGVAYAYPGGGNASRRGMPGQPISSGARRKLGRLRPGLPDRRFEQ